MENSQGLFRKVGRIFTDNTFGLFARLGWQIGNMEKFNYFIYCNKLIKQKIIKNGSKWLSTGPTLSNFTSISSYLAP